MHKINLNYLVLWNYREDRREVANIHKALNLCVKESSVDRYPVVMVNVCCQK